jgi:CBS domain-containing protein
MTQQEELRDVLTAEDIMTAPVIGASRRTTVRDAAIQMFLGGFSGMPVTERDGTVVGIITEFDVIKALRKGREVETLLAEDIMSRDVIGVDVSAGIDELLGIFETHKVLRVPVTEGGRLVGIISRPDVLRACIEPNFMTFE